MAALASTSAAIFAAGVIIVAQVILPATMDLLGSIALVGIGGWCGWQAAKNRA